MKTNSCEPCEGSGLGAEFEEKCDKCNGTGEAKGPIATSEGFRWFKLPTIEQDETNSKEFWRKNFRYAPTPNRPDMAEVVVHKKI
jgi:hypothetical protein